MRQRHGERAVTVQIGAVLLLAIVFAALALYQVNAVPAENQAIESEHNQQVHGEMQDLRNAIKDVGTSGGPDSRSVSISLGTDYPTRTFLTNPPDPTGTLTTTDPGTIRIDNATVNGSYTGDVDSLVETDYETRTLVYEPSYNEYRGAPSTRIEHGFTFNDYGDTALGMTPQPLIDDDRITIVLVDGNLSTSSGDVTTVDAQLLDGPTEPVDLDAQDGNITIRVPTDSPTAWNETVGTTFRTGTERARVTAYADGQLAIELEDDPNENYELQMARIGVGDASSDGTDEFDISAIQPDDKSSSAYDVRWNPSRMEADNDNVSCSDDSCTFTASSTGKSATAFVETAPSVNGATIDYAVRNGSVATFSKRGIETVQNGENATELVAVANGTTTAYVQGTGTSDELELTVEIESDGPGVPDGSVAYHDENGNGEYDDGEPTYAESDLETLDVAGSLVVAEDAFSANGMAITANQLTVADGARLATENGGIQLTANGGELAVAGTLDTTAGSGQSVTLDSDDTTTLSDGTIRSSGAISVSSVGAVVADDATFDGTDANSGSIGVSSDGSISIQRASVTTEGGITTTAGSSLDATDATFGATGDGEEIALESSGDMTLDRAAIDVGSSGTMSGALNQGSNTLFVDAAEFRRNGGPGTFEYSPNGVDVVGEPAVGSTN